MQPHSEVIDSISFLDLVSTVDSEFRIGVDISKLGVQALRSPMLLAKAMLEGAGYTVLAASTPSEAMRIAEQHASIDLLVTDVIMPEMNGYDLATRLSLLFPGLPSLFVSGYTGSEIRRQGASEAGMHFLEKPFTVRDLTNAVRGALGAGQ